MLDYYSEIVSGCATVVFLYVSGTTIPFSETQFSRHISLYKDIFFVCFFFNKSFIYKGVG